MNYSMDEGTIEDILNKVKYFILPSKDNNYKSKFLQSRLLFYFIVLLFVLRIGATLISINIPHNIFFADITKSSLEFFANQTRQSLGLPVLTENVKLNKAAQLKAQNMVQQQYFAHVSPSGISPWYWFYQSGYNYKYAGENLAIGFYDSKEVYQAWLNSPEHKANIINPNYTDVGTAVMSGIGPNNAIVVVQEFGSQAKTVSVAKTENTKHIVTQPKIKPIENSKPIEKPVQNIVPTTNTQSSTVNPKVLAQETVLEPVLEPVNNSSAGVFSKVMNSIIYNYDKILQDIIFGIALIVIGILLTLIFFSFDIKLNRSLALRAVTIIVVLSAATLVNKDFIVALIPHKLII